MNEQKVTGQKEEQADAFAKAAWQSPVLREIDARMTMSAAAVPNNDGSGENTSAAS